MAGRQTRGRQRIPIVRIQNQDDLYATFSKRRIGLYNKASQLCTLCGVDIGIIIFSPTNNSYSFFHPNKESVVERYRNPGLPQNHHSRAVASTIRSRIDDLNRTLDQIIDEKECLKEHNNYLDEIDRTRQKGWWEETPIESLNIEQVKEWIEWFQAFKAQVENQIEVLKNGGSGSALNQQAGGTGVDPSSYAPGPLYAPEIGAGQFAGPDYVAQASSSGGSANVPNQYYFPHDASGGGESGYMPSPYFYPPLSLDQSVGGESGSFFFTSEFQDPSGAGGSSQIPSATQDPSNNGGSDGLVRFSVPPPPFASADLIPQDRFSVPPPPFASADLIPQDRFSVPPPPSAGADLIPQDLSTAGGSGQFFSYDEEQQGR